ncbi:RecX family transcriptional regulator [Sphingomonas spermidinifaciens]|uniref:RecX family transcriptional regulator n=1 Tax=Sphingomonas spermidinifaciens TaxID=1141889 RepID=A0A2A4B2D0_9SPHN|nr:regulatory protein RecX [Sphingomonas spermidinifaciens]PCD01888.1 RecX family transcriptional regulator [Sphingomonas spermidinifaciens]
MPGRKPSLRPYDAKSLERSALRYVERFATTRGKLADYLTRKLRERGWAEESEPPVEALAERFAELGYIDDRAWGEAKAAAMTRRGLGARRVRQALGAAGIAGEDMAAIDEAAGDAAVESAVAFARRKRIGPFGPGSDDRAVIERQVGQMVRAGHPPDLARRIARMEPPSSDPEFRFEDADDVAARLKSSLS